MATILNASEPLGLDVRRLADVVERLAASQPPGLTLSVGVQLATVLPLLQAMAGRNELARDVAEGMRTGRTMVALAATDMGTSGGTLTHSETAAVQRDGDIILNGCKAWITNADQCDEALVLAKTRQAPHVTSFSWLLVPMDTPGVTTSPENGEWLRGAGLGSIFFNNVVLSPRRIVGRSGWALADLTRQLAAERLFGAVWARAACRHAVDATRNHLHHRRGAEGPLWGNAAIRERLARCLVRWAELDAMCERQLTAPADPVRSMVLKASFAEAADQILAECVQLQGAHAFRAGGLAETRAELSMFGIAGGATGSMLAVVADRASDLLGMPHGA